MYLFYNSDGHLTFTKQFEQKQNQMNVNISIIWCFTDILIIESLTQNICFLS